jgi:hypothetical protein
MPQTSYCLCAGQHLAVVPYCCSFLPPICRIGFFAAAYTWPKNVSVTWKIRPLASNLRSTPNSVTTSRKAAVKRPNDEVSFRAECWMLRAHRRRPQAPAAATRPWLGEASPLLTRATTVAAPVTQSRNVPGGLNSAPSFVHVYPSLQQQVKVRSFRKSRKLIHWHRVNEHAKWRLFAQRDGTREKVTRYLFTLRLSVHLLEERANGKL